MSDIWIKKQVLKRSMIAPFVSSQVRKNTLGTVVLSYGLSSYGYDARLSDEFKVLTNINTDVVDPKDFSKKILVDKKSNVCVIPPHGFVLSRTVEYFKIPKNILVLCVGKSTYARCGLIVNVTPIEPGWEGYVTLELSNTTSLPLKIYASEGICQFLFFRGDKNCNISYADRRGKYMKQNGITLPI